MKKKDIITAFCTIGYVLFVFAGLRVYFLDETENKSDIMENVVQFCVSHTQKEPVWIDLDNSSSQQVYCLDEKNIPYRIVIKV